MRRRSRCSVLWSARLRRLRAPCITPWMRCSTRSTPMLRGATRPRAITQMPTNELEPEFFREYGRLNTDQREQLKEAVRALVDDLTHKRPFRASLRVKGVQGHPNIF